MRLHDRREAPTTEGVSNPALAFMAHELRTPLTAIIGMSDLLNESPLSVDQRDMLDILGRSARALIEIVNGVLDLEKLEAGKLQLERRAFSPADCVEECINLLAATAAQKRLDLAFHIDDTVPPLIQGDPARLRQTLINLLGNALKFTETGQVVVTVSGTLRTADRCELQFAVADSGPGIPPEYMASMFEPYAQAEPSTSRRFGGTGLGLPITKRLVELMGGNLEVASEVGRGSSFSFVLSTEIDEAAGVRAGAKDDGLAGQRILVIEDNPVVGELLVSTLAHWKVRATLATDLPRAVAAIRDGTFSAALIDGDLPGVSGRAVALALRSLPGTSALPLVLMTTLGAANASADRWSSGREGQFAAHVTKPIRPSKLHDALIQALGGGPDDTGHPPPDPNLPRPSRRGSDVQAAAEQRLAGVRVLLIENDDGLRAVLQRSMSIVGAEVLAVADGPDTLAAASTWHPDAIVLDSSIPGMDAFELCRRLKSDPTTRLVPIIMMTGPDTASDRLRVAEAGADAMMPKPFAREDLLARVRSVARMKQATDQLGPAGEEIVMTARAVEGRDPDTLGHLERISDYSARLAERLGMNADDVAALRLSGLVHDVGKAALPDTLINKPDTLDEREWELMRSHPVESARLCGGITAFDRAIPAIRHHHEKLDGSGYPDGLAGNAIPPAARVLQMVDVYDALTTARPYRLAESPEGALGIMKQEVDRGWWDPGIFSAFRDLIRSELLGRRGTGIGRH